jgi:t-SNARE complex subunit (syntaxin)
MSNKDLKNNQEIYCETNDKLIRERDSKINDIAKQVNEIHGLFTELNTLILEQGETLTNQIEPTIERSLLNTKKSLGYLKEASLR